jgi:hypothetical protein
MYYDREWQNVRLGYLFVDTMYQTYEGDMAVFLNIIFIFNLKQDRHKLLNSSQLIYSSMSRFISVMGAFINL